MGLGSIITGLSIYKPVTFSWLSWLCGGYKAARVEHFALTIGYCLFFVVHIVQVVIAGWNNFRSMITGFDVLSVETLSFEEKVEDVPTIPDPPAIIPANS
jgi:hypothetical protein